MQRSEMPFTRTAPVSNKYFFRSKNMKIEWPPTRLVHCKVKAWPQSDRVVHSRQNLQDRSRLHIRWWQTEDREMWWQIEEIWWQTEEREMTNWGDMMTDWGDMMTDWGERDDDRLRGEMMTDWGERWWQTEERWWQTEGRDDDRLRRDMMTD